MKYLKKFNESKEDDGFNEIFKHIEDLCLEFGDLGLDYKVRPTTKAPDWAIKDFGNNSPLPHTILIEITDTSYGFQIDRETFNNVVKSIKDYVESEGCNFFISRYDEHDNYYLNDDGYTTFEEYLKDEGNFYGFEIRVF
jgi:hypothetical protein